MILELIVAIEASLLSASWIRRSLMRRREILMGGGISEITLPFLDRYIRQQTTNPTRLQTFAAQKLAAVCRYEAPCQPVDRTPMAIVSVNRGEKGSDAFGPVKFCRKMVVVVNFTKGALPKHCEFSSDIVGGEKG